MEKMDFPGGSSPEELSGGPKNRETVSSKDSWSSTQGEECDEETTTEKMNRIESRHEVPDTAKESLSTSSYKRQLEDTESEDDYRTQTTSKKGHVTASSGDSDTEAIEEGVPTRTHTANPFEPHEHDTEPRHDDFDLVVTMKIRKSVYVENVSNNADPESRILATIACAREINVSTEPQVRSFFNPPVTDGSNEYDEQGTSTAPLYPASILPLGLKYIKLEELLLANEVWQRPSAKELPPIKASGPGDITEVDLCRLLHFIYSTTVNQHRHLAGFKRLSLEDQLALMKERYCDLIMIRLAILHDTRNDKTKVGYPGQSSFQAGTPKQLMRNGAHKDKVVKSLRSLFPDEYRSNESMLVILSAIGLFETEDVVLGEEEVICEQQRWYYQLLSEYLVSTFGSRHARTAFRLLTAWLNCVRLRIRTMEKDAILLEFDPETCELVSLKLNHSLLPVNDTKTEAQLSAAAP